MTKARLPWLTAVVAAAACGGGNHGSSVSVGDAGAESSVQDAASAGGQDAPAGDARRTDDGSVESGDDGPSGAVNNAAPVTVNAGPPGTASVDIPFVSVTVCVPGTATCQTIDYVSVDTGSSGLRIVASALSGLALPQQTATTGSALAECMQFADGYTWGSVRLADVTVGGEVAHGIPVQIIGDPLLPVVPTDCSSSGPAENTVQTFGAYGLLGINQIVPDCGAYCADTTNVGTGAYYSCSGSACTAVAVSDANQVSNPIPSFASDNNGAVLEFPTIPAAGAVSLAGTLVFGIGTAPNNSLGNASVQTIDANGDFTTVFNGTTFGTSFIDSGTNYLAFNDSSITQCTGGLAGYYCPASTLSLMAQTRGINGVTSTISFSVANTQTLFGSASDAVFDDLAGTGLDNTSFDWGLPFFFGRSVFIALDGATTPGGKGPYVAY
jgi:hypothetical protein